MATRTPNRQERRAAERNGATPTKGLPARFTLELSLEEMGFLRLLLTNATLQPAEAKRICALLQSKVEEQVGPMQAPQQ